MRKGGGGVQRGRIIGYAPTNVFVKRVRDSAEELVNAHFVETIRCLSGEGSDVLHGTADRFRLQSRLKVFIVELAEMVFRQPHRRSPKVQKERSVCLRSRGQATERGVAFASTITRAHRKVASFNLLFESGTSLARQLNDLSRWLFDRLLAGPSLSSHHAQPMCDAKRVRGGRGII